MINNSVTPRTPPDLIQQSAALTSDVGDGSLGPHVQNGKLLIAIWPPTGIVTDVCLPVSPSPPLLPLKQLPQAWRRTAAGESVEAAKSDLTTAAETILTTATTLSFSFAFASPPDLLILPLPPAVSLPFNRLLAGSNATALQTLSDLDDHFDSRLNITISALTISAASTSTPSSNERQRVFTFPLRDWFDNMVATPASNDLTSSTSPCFDGKAVCSDPKGFAFWDWVHWSSTMHDRLASALSRVITSA